MNRKKVLWQIWDALLEHIAKLLDEEKPKATNLRLAIVFLKNNGVNYQTMKAQGIIENDKDEIMKKILDELPDFEEEQSLIE